MEEIAREFGMCVLYMLPIVLLTAFFIGCIGTDGMLHDIVYAYLTGLTG